MIQGMAQRKIYVLDTNVIVHDPQAIQHFDEHDLVLPIAVLEEMDKIKRGFNELARNVREASRFLDDLSECSPDLSKGCPLPGGGRLFFELEDRGLEMLPESLAKASGDNRIIAITMALKREQPERDVILVSKDINLRIKARALGIQAEDYRTDRVIEDPEHLPKGYEEIDGDRWSKIVRTMQVVREADREIRYVRWPETMPLPEMNSFLLPAGEEDRPLRCVRRDEAERRIGLVTVPTYRSERRAVWGIQSRNIEQSMAINLLLDRDLDLVALAGRAGTGKTLLALACGLHQCLEKEAYESILVTRATVPMGQDIGYLPGTEREKLEPWMGAITDNLRILIGEDFRSAADALVRHKIEITALSFARGRTFTRTWLIVDEAQNLTPHQMRTLITRMGEGSKIIILGNNAQIDTPYLSAHNNGLSMAMMRFYGWEHAGCLILQASVRSRLAAYAAEVL